MIFSVIASVHPNADGSIGALFSYKRNGEQQHYYITDRELIVDGWHPPTPRLTPRTSLQIFLEHWAAELIKEENK